MFHTAEMALVSPGLKGSLVSKVQRRTSTYPGVVALAKRDYEVLRLGYKVISRRYGIPRSTVAFLATSQKWVKPGPPPPSPPEGDIAARGVEPATLAEGLCHCPRAGEPPAEPVVKRPRGRPRKQRHSEEIPARSIMSSAEPESDTPALEGQPPDPPSSKAAVSASPEGPRSPRSPEAPDRLKRKGAKDAQTAIILNFPTLPPPPRNRMGAIHTLPELTGEEKAKFRVTLAAIRARMSLEQLAQLERHEALLGRYGHLLDVYLDPVRFVDLAGLNDDEKAAKILATQQQALGTLLPTARDTLAGAIKTLTDAVQQVIMLKRKVVGLDKVKAGSDSVRPADSLAEAGDKPQLVSLESMTPEQIRIGTARDGSVSALLAGEARCANAAAARADP